MKFTVLDLDTQKDFLIPTGAMFIDNDNETIINNISTAMRSALTFGSPLISSTISNDRIYRFCVTDSEGFSKIDETVFVEPEMYYNCPNLRNGIDMSVASECWHVNFEKGNTDIWDPLYGQSDNLETFLRTEDINTIFIVGVNFEASMELCIEGLLKSKYHVHVITDAIWCEDMDEIKHLREMFAPEDVEFITTKEFVAQINSNETQYTPRG